MKPLVELSFTPNPIASTKSTAFHYAGMNSPPTDMALYGTYVKNFVQAVVDYFGVEEVATWKFEVYNEPDLQLLGCTSHGTRTNASDSKCKYFDMFRECS